MADTKRSSADLLANLFQDGQAAGSITAQDIRDLIVSMVPSIGLFSMNTPAATTITVAGTYYKAAGTTTFEADTTDFSDDSGVSNRIKYIGTPDRHAKIMAALSVTCGGSNQILGFKIAVNGTVVDDSIVRHKVGTGSDVVSIPLVGHFDLTTNDYIEIFVTNETSTATVTIEECKVMVEGLIR